LPYLTPSIPTKSKLHMLILVLLLSVNCSAETLGVSCFISHVLSPLLRSYQRIHPSLKPYILFHNMLVLAVGGYHICQTPHTGGPLLVSYPPYLQLSFISVSCLYHSQPKNVPCHDTRDSLNMTS